MISTDDARLLASARVILRRLNDPRHLSINSFGDGRIAEISRRAEEAIADTLSLLDIYADDPVARRFKSATNQDLIDSL